MFKVQSFTFHLGELRDYSDPKPSQKTHPSNSGQHLKIILWFVCWELFREEVFFCDFWTYLFEISFQGVQTTTRWSISIVSVQCKVYWLWSRSIQVSHSRNTVGTIWPIGISWIFVRIIALHVPFPHVINQDFKASKMASLCELPFSMSFFGGFSCQKKHVTCVFV